MIMSNHNQSYFLHSDRTLNARTPHMVAASSRKPAIKKHNHWSGPCERGRARQCMMKCSGFCETAWIRLRNERQNLTSNARCKIRPFFPEGCQRLTNTCWQYLLAVPVGSASCQRLTNQRLTNVSVLLTPVGSTCWQYLLAVPLVSVLLISVLLMSASY